MRARMLVAIVLGLILAVPCFANPSHAKRASSCVKCADTVLKNPDGRTSITVTAGLGTLDGLRANDSADLTAVGIGLVYPASPNFSLLANWDHSKGEWGQAARWGLADFHSNLFTVGVRFYLGD